MTITVLYAGAAEQWPAYQPALTRAFADAGLDVALSDSAPDPAAVDYLVYAPSGGLTDFTPFTRAKAVLSLWAGVERVVGEPTLTQPLCRMVDHSLSAGMIEYVAGHALRHHLGMDAHILGQDGKWRSAIVPPLASERPVTVLGLGVLGRAVAGALAGLGFPVTGWSRSPREIPGIRCLSGREGLHEALSSAAILVTLLPSTPETENVVDAAALAAMPEGAFIINPGRGGAIDDEALLEALDTGRIAHATLDVFRAEPVPPEHPFWAHPRVTVTPHVAAATRPGSVAAVIAENIRRGEAGEPFLYLVDRSLGY